MRATFQTRLSRIFRGPAGLYPAACRLVMVLLALLYLGGCVPPWRPDAGALVHIGRNAPQFPRLNCFLNLKESGGPAVRLEVASIEVLTNGLWLPITSGPLKIDSEKIGSGQLFIAGLRVPPGRYRRLRLKVTEGSVWQADGKYAFISREPFIVEVPFTEDLNIEPEDSSSLFITWDVLKSVEADNRLRPVLTVSPSVKQLQADLVFVACPDIDTIFVVRADKNWVVNSFGLKGGPTYLAVDNDPSSQRLYVLASRERMIKVVDLASYQVVDYFPIPLNDAPTFMTVSPDGQEAFLLDPHSGYLIRMDLSTGQNIARVQLGYQPRYAVFLEGQNLLAVSLSLSQKVLLLDPSSLAVVGSIPTGSSPSGLLPSDNQLYIAESGENTVSVADLAGLGNQDRLTVGFGPRRLIEVAGRIYVSNYEGGSLSVLVPGQLGVVQEVYGLGHPLEMTFDRAYNRIYVADEETGALAVVNANSNQLLGRIALGARPRGLGIIQ
jgi:hypothetical protein